MGLRFAQQYATAAYRSELALRLRGLGYEVERGESGQPEVKGYSREYLEASSPRRRQIKEHLAEAGRSGAGAAQIAAHQTREEKSASLTWSMRSPWCDPTTDIRATRRIVGVWKQGVPAKPAAPR